MDLDGVQIRPTEGMLAVKFIDDDDDEEDESPNASEPSEPMEYEGCIAIVVAVGPKVAIKKGDTIVTGPYARNGMKLGGLCLISTFDVKATLAVP